MGILQRIEEIRAVEHARLRMALSRADAVLRELEQARVEAAEAEPVRTIDMFGQPEEVEAAPPTASLRPLLSAWEGFEAKVIERLNGWEETLWPLVRRWNRGEQVSKEIRAFASELQSSAARIDQLLGMVRTQASFVGETRSTMLVVYRAVDVARKAEEQLIPALLAGSREVADRTAETAIPRMRSAADITQSLRAGRARDEEERLQAERPRTGFMQQFFDWLVRKEER
ncbi:MAG: hypothetical protein AAF602_20705 [Myxococcota bacterium]